MSSRFTFAVGIGTDRRQVTVSARNLVEAREKAREKIALRDLYRGKEPPIIVNLELLDREDAGKVETKKRSLRIGYLGKYPCGACGKKIRVYDWLPESVLCAACKKEIRAQEAKAESPESDAP